MDWLACSLYPDILTKWVVYNETPLYIDIVVSVQILDASGSRTHWTIIITKYGST